MCCRSVRGCRSGTKRNKVPVDPPENATPTSSSSLVTLPGEHSQTIVSTRSLSILVPTEKTSLSMDKIGRSLMKIVNRFEGGVNTIVQKIKETQETKKIRSLTSIATTLDGSLDTVDDVTEGGGCGEGLFYITSLALTTCCTALVKAS